MFHMKSILERTKCKAFQCVNIYCHKSYGEYNVSAYSLLIHSNKLSRICAVVMILQSSWATSYAEKF